MNTEELEKEYELAKKLINAIITATGRLRNTLVWECFSDDVYMAEWENTYKLLFIHKDMSYELYVIDKSGFHDLLIMRSVGESMHNLFDHLKTAICIQIDRYRMQHRLVTTQKEYIRDMVKKLSQ